MGSGVRHGVERIVLGLLAFAGIAAVIADFFGWLDELSPGSTLPKISLLILSTVTLFLLLEVDRLKSLGNVGAQLSKLDIDAIAEKHKNAHYAGVIEVHEHFPEDKFLGYLRSAKHEVAILQTFIPDLQRLEAALEEVIAKRRIRVRILLVHPSSPVTQLRDEALRKVQSPDLAKDVRKEVESCLCRLESIFQRAPKHRERLEVRVYNSLPSIAMYRADDHYFVSSFLHGRLAVDSTQREIHGSDTVMGKEVQREMDILWEIGCKVDLRDWRGSINAINP